MRAEVDVQRGRAAAQCQRARRLVERDRQLARQLAAQARTLGVDIDRMQERADEIGGRVEVSSLARGTLVSLRLPLGEGASR